MNGNNQVITFDKVPVLYDTVRVLKDTVCREAVFFRESRGLKLAGGDAKSYSHTNLEVPGTVPGLRYIEVERMVLESPSLQKAAGQPLHSIEGFTDGFFIFNLNMGFQQTNLPLIYLVKGLTPVMQWIGTFDKFKASVYWDNGFQAPHDFDLTLNFYGRTFLEEIVRHDGRPMFESDVKKKGSTTETQGH